MVEMLEVVGVTKFYDNRKILDSVSLSVARGERLVILGPNGSGKTTLLEIIAGIIQPYEGMVIIEGNVVSEFQGGKRVKNVPPEYRGVGYVPQNYALFPHMNVYDNIAFGLKAKKVPKLEERRRVTSIARLLGIEGLLHKYPSQLSGGQQQRVALARALVVEPRVLLMDEPFSSIDAMDRERVRAEISKIVGELDIAVVTVTHSFADAWSMGDRIAVLIKGKLVRVDNRERLAFDPGDLLVAEYLGFNIMRGRVIDVIGEDVVVDLGGQRLTVGLEPDIKILKGDDVALVFRRDDPVLTECGGASRLGGNVLKARVEESFLTKYSFIAKLNVNGQNIIVESGRGLVSQLAFDLRGDSLCITLHKNLIKIIKI
ncbi:MAG: ABC transporter ATP-binding protein [Desulfurococcales archaeon]|nr:ABC transporter ATP-binding protein [Desulfurococcales archaeon]